MLEFRGMINVRDKELIIRFGDNLRKIRIEKGFTQEKLAFNAEITLSQVGRIERGKINTTISTAYLLAKVLEVDISRLFE